MRSPRRRFALRLAAAFLLTGGLGACASGDGSFAPPDCTPVTSTQPGTPADSLVRDTARPVPLPESPPNACTRPNA